VNVILNNIAAVSTTSNNACTNAHFDIKEGDLFALKYLHCLALANHKGFTEVKQQIESVKMAVTKKLLSIRAKRAAPAITKRSSKKKKSKFTINLDQTQTTQNTPQQELCSSSEENDSKNLTLLDHLVISSTESSQDPDSTETAIMC